MKDGILIINKPEGLTSHDVVDFVRKRLEIRKVGHSGTLDPMATGVLLILVGKCTKLFNHFLKLDKEYVASLTLGAKTTSGDSDGKVIQRQESGYINEEMVREVFNAYVGEIMQVPPMVSALKYKGKPLYKLARRGIEVPRRPRRVTIKELRLLNFIPPDIKFYLRCSSGTYVRQLAQDIARDLGSIGYISQLERQSIGPFNLNQAVTIDRINESHIQLYNMCKNIG